MNDIDNRLRILTDPEFAEATGKDLAARSGALGVDFVVAWYEPESVILAHIVARELRIPVVSAEDSEGLIGLLAPPAAGGRGLIVADSFSGTRSVRAIIGAIANAGSEVAGVAVLDSSSALAGIDPELPVVAAGRGE